MILTDIRNWNVCQRGTNCSDISICETHLLKIKNYAIQLDEYRSKGFHSANVNLLYTTEVAHPDLEPTVKSHMQEYQIMTRMVGKNLPATRICKGYNQ